MGSAPTQYSLISVCLHYGMSLQKPELKHNKLNYDVCLPYCVQYWQTAHQQQHLKAQNYAHLDSMYLFKPVALETGGTIGPKSRDFLKKLGRQLKTVTGEAWSCTFLLQRISITIQVGTRISNLTSHMETIYICSDTVFSEATVMELIDRERDKV